MKITLNVLKNFIKGAGEKNLSVYAAGIAFFWILSAVPIIVVISSIFPYTRLSEEIIAEYIIRFLPETTRHYLLTLIRYVFTHNARLLPVALFIAIWSAGRGMLSMIRSFNEIHGIDEERGYLKLRLIASLYTIILLTAIIFSLMVLVFGESIYQVILISAPVLGEILERVLKIRYILAVLMLSIILTFLYTYVPNIETTLKKQFPGGLLAALGCTVFSYCFSVYVDNFNDFSNYGSINIVIIIMLWLYFTMYILLYGAYIGNYLTKEGSG